MNITNHFFKKEERQYNGEMIVSQKMMLEQLDIHIKIQIFLDMKFKPFTKNTEIGHRCKCKAQHYKIPRKCLVESIVSFLLCDDCFRYNLEGMIHKRQIVKENFIKI